MAVCQPSPSGWDRLRRLCTRSNLPQVIQEFRRRLDAADEQMISCSCTGDVEKVAFGIVDLLKFRLVADPLDALLQRDDLIVARHDCDGSEFKSFGQMHRADRDAADCRL